MKLIDFRSDTGTSPTQNMREAMYRAVVGDDVYGDDPTMKELEEYAAKLVGKEAAMFTPSGTFANQVCIMTHCKRGDEILVGEKSHIVMSEVGASAVLSGVHTMGVKENDQEIDVADLKNKIRHNNIHYPSSGLVCMETAHSCGKVASLENMKQVYELAKEYNIPVHIDGARLFNAATYLNADVKEITKYTDTVAFCLSKGLCAPMGSIVAGSKEFIQIAKKNRKLMGGGLRQSGFVAAAGLVALKEMIPNLKNDNENAIYMAKKLSDIGAKVNVEDIHINILFADVSALDIDEDNVVEFFRKNNIIINPPNEGIMRFLTSYHTKKEEIDYFIDILNKYLDIINIKKVSNL